MDHRPQHLNDLPVSPTVYSVVWPSTEQLIRRVLVQEAEQMLDRHRNAHTKRQDPMHEGFFDAWLRFASPVLTLPGDATHHYPTAGSSEAIREIIRQAAWKDQDVVIFAGEYEGYEAIANTQGTRVHRVDRHRWREVLEGYARDGAPWQGRGAQWWISQPSALDGNDWPDFQEWLLAVERWSGSLDVWVDLTYLGRSTAATAIDLSASPVVAGIVFSLSKVMGAYYRRIGGCISRAPVEGLWANRWFKNLDSLYLGQAWLEQAGNAVSEGRLYAVMQHRAMGVALQGMGGAQAWHEAGIQWQASDVPLLMHAPDPTLAVPSALEPWWQMARRGAPASPSSRRLCLTPTLTALFAPTQPGRTR